MSFVHPLMLIGLVAAAIPALLHLITRQQPPELEFPALRHLREAARRSAQRVKLRHLVLLALRTALLVLIVLAAARPLVPTAAGGGHAPTALVVILDNSPSSGVVVDGRPVLERLRGAARASVAGAAPGDRLWLTLADGIVRAGERAALLAVIDSVGVAPWRLDLSGAVTRAVEVVGGERLSNREVHVVSDLQRTALGHGGVTPGHTRVLVLEPAGTAPANRGVGSAVVTDGELTVTVVGTPGTAPGAVTVRVAGGIVGHALAGPGAAVPVVLPPARPGWWSGEVSLDPDELRADDRRPFVWHVARASEARAAPDAGPFVAAAVTVLASRAGSRPGALVQVGGLPASGPSVVLPPADPSLLGELDRALAVRGSQWRYGAIGTPGLLASAAVPALGGQPVARRYRLEAVGAGDGSDSAVLATVNGEPWLVRDGDLLLLGSRLDTLWTELPARAAFLPFVDALVNRLVWGEAGIDWKEGSARIEFRMRGADTVGASVYGLDPRESDLTPATREEAARALGAVVLDAQRFGAARFAGGRRADASGLMLALALIVATVELGVATLTR